ncbi:MAG TPA: hypothetical protein PLT76_01455 [Candidatus Omnitrophota bacterium]|nr:hypothetical protein [Candidatus Omnitrophota bacterium]HQO57375.1 hypothetical protein [Candidatus Omnitrophota bacterium]HQP12390.1 hypothetical protein [Candidatus Omnitrophota bacterium]
MLSFYDKVYKECEVYFGADTKRFLDRQIECHINKTAQTLDYSDREMLAKWIRISGGLILSKEEAEELSAKILTLK